MRGNSSFSSPSLSSLSSFPPSKSFSPSLSSSLPKKNKSLKSSHCFHFFLFYFILKNQQKINQNILLEPFYHSLSFPLSSSFTSPSLSSSPLSFSPYLSSISSISPSSSSSSPSIFPYLSFNFLQKNSFLYWKNYSFSVIPFSSFLFNLQKIRNPFKIFQLNFPSSFVISSSHFNLNFIIDISNDSGSSSDSNSNNAGLNSDHSNNGDYHEEISNNQSNNNNFNNPSFQNSNEKQNSDVLLFIRKGIG